MDSVCFVIWWRLPFASQPQRAREALRWTLAASAIVARGLSIAQLHDADAQRPPAVDARVKHQGNTGSSYRAELLAGRRSSGAQITVTRLQTIPLLLHLSSTSAVRLS